VRGQAVSFITVSHVWFTIAAGILSCALGIAYCAKSRAVARDFKLVLSDHKRLLTMALINQGLGLCFIGAVVILAAVFGRESLAGRVIEWASAAMLFVLGFVTAATGGRGEYVIFRFGQLGLLVAAILIAVGMAPK
jgi:hypothetical protein